MTNKAVTQCNLRWCKRKKICESKPKQQRSFNGPL